MVNCLLSLHDALTAVYRSFKKMKSFPFWFWLPLLAQSSISPIFLIEARLLQMNIFSQWEGPRNHWQPIRGHKHPYSDWDTSIQINGCAAVAKTLAEVQSGIFSSSAVRRGLGQVGHYHSNAGLQLTPSIFPSCTQTTWGWNALQCRLIT